jgi:hypothetical protein
VVGALDGAVHYFKDVAPRALEITIAVTAQNDAPVNHVPGTQEVQASTPVAITGLSIADVDAGSGTLTTTLTVAHGALTVLSNAGASVLGSGTGTVTLTGTVAQINTTLAAANSIVYTGAPGFFGADRLTMTTSDGGNTGTGGALSDTDHVTINVNKLITASGPIAANGFDYAYYLQHNPDVAAAGVDPLQHYETFGWKEGRNPNALFDTNGYLATYTDVRDAHVNPLDHYHQSGWREGRDPSVAFDTTTYLSTYTDVANAHIDPLVHFLASGNNEGRSTFADGVWG